MKREAALILIIILFIVFMVISYYGAGVTLWSSIIFGLFIALVLLNIFYPPGNIATDTPDFTLVLYAVIQITGIILLSIYITQRTLTDVR